MELQAATQHPRLAALIILAVFAAFLDIDSYPATFFYLMVSPRFFCIREERHLLCFPVEGDIFCPESRGEIDAVRGILRSPVYPVLEEDNVPIR